MFHCRRGERGGMSAPTPPPVVAAVASKMEVDDAPLSTEAKDRMKAVGITHLTPVQERTIRAVVVDQLDVLVRAPTGSGKTLAYLLPIAHALARLPPADLSTPGRPNAIVFLPTRELAAQVHEHAERHVAAAGFPCALVVGGADEKSQLAAVRANARCVIGTPGRIKEFVDRGVIKTDGVIAQVLDEADRLLDGGFERDVESVMTPPGGAARTMCLSATMPQSLARFLQRQLPPDHAVIDMFGKGGGNVGGSVEHLAVTTRPIDLVGVVLDAIDAYASGGGQSHRGDIDDGQSQRATGQTIVFVETKAFAEQLSGTLAIAYEVRGTLGRLGHFGYFSSIRPPIFSSFFSPAGSRTSPDAPAAGR